MMFKKAKLIAGSAVRLLAFSLLILMLFLAAIGYIVNLLGMPIYIIFIRYGSDITAALPVLFRWWLPWPFGLLISYLIVRWASNRLFYVFALPIPIVIFAGLDTYEAIVTSAAAPPPEYNAAGSSLLMPIIWWSYLFILIFVLVLFRKFFVKREKPKEGKLLRHKPITEEFESWW